jgi:hypothetical protein
MDVLTMKRQTFRLGAVLRYYGLQKQRSELELQKASNALHQTEVAIEALKAEIAALGDLLQGEAAANLSTSGLIACFQRAKSLDAVLVAAQARRQKQAEVVLQLAAQRKKWSQAEETVLSLRRSIEENNKTEADKAQQLLLDETVLRRWPLDDENSEPRLAFD